MFWWGLAVAVGSAVLTLLLQRATTALYSSEMQAAFYQTFGELLVSLLFLSQLAGVVLVVGGLVVRSLQR